MEATVTRSNYNMARLDAKSKAKNFGVFDVEIKGKFISIYAEVHMIAVTIAIMIVGIASCIIGF